ncbi:YbjQ family protein [Clostridium rectalis]|uniref:YbjQ family protein n=1 Tax=Clostridium rectalis TaxID=2040295 RepID=UPI000F6443FE|nr:YbjQ family protein [Clostridium rectalis]
MIITNMDKIPGKEIEFLDMVNCSAVYAKNFGKDIMAGFKNLVGGELTGYSEMVDDARTKALDKIKKKGESLGADAVLNIRYTMTSMTQGSAIAVIATGTAVKFI